MKERLDVLLVKRNLADSREKAKALIMSGIVYVNGQKEDKAGTTFDETAPIEVRGNTLKYVSRGGLKLEKAMDAKALELLKVFELDDKASLLASGLPYGDQRKLEIARALATQPKLLLLDEPAAGMNPNETAELMDTIRFVRDNFDMTVLLIEQNANMALKTANLGYVMETGRITLHGSGEELLANEAVKAAYLGT